MANIMANFDLHDKCARCRDKLIGEDKCVLKKPCVICDGFSESQRELLATPTYKIRKDKKAGLLISSKDVTAISSVDSEPTFQSPSGAMAQVPAQPPSDLPTASSSPSTQPSHVTAEQFAAMSDKWAEQFAHMEALLSRGNVFSTPVSAVKPIDTQSLISTTPFVPPATRPTGPVEVPVAVEDSAKQKKHDDKDKKKRAHKAKKHDKPNTEDIKPAKTPGQERDPKPVKKRDQSTSPVRKHSSSKGRSRSPPAVASSGPESANQPAAKKGGCSLFALEPDFTTGSTGQPSVVPLHTVQGQSSSGALPTHRGQTADNMNSCQMIMNLTVLKDFQFLMMGNCLTLQKSLSRQKKCLIGRRSGQYVPIWVGITSLP